LTKADTLNAVGTMVYCTVDQVRGWYRVTAVRPRDGYIKIEGVSTWNPPHNFAVVDARGRAWEATS
jgi:hypothetical protein